MIYSFLFLFSLIKNKKVIIDFTLFDNKIFIFVHSAKKTRPQVQFQAVNSTVRRFFFSNAKLKQIFV